MRASPLRPRVRARRAIDRVSFVTLTIGFASSLVIGRAPAQPRVVLPDWYVDGESSVSVFGWGVKAGDTDGDLIDDVIVGAPLFQTGSGAQSGAAYAYLGSVFGPSTAWDWRVEGTFDVDERLGRSVGVGDFDGDGYADVVVGMPHAFAQDGSVEVYYGTPSGPELTPSLTLQSQQGGSWFGRSVAGAGDVNGDGADDLLVGAVRYDSDSTDVGAVYLYLGDVKSGLGAFPDWGIIGVDTGGELGFKVASAGDVNGDTYDDVIVTAWMGNGDGSGAAYVYHGGPGGLSFTPDWSAAGTQPDANFGVSAGTAGDVNGDTFDDVIVGAYLFDGPAGVDAGRAHIYHGSPSGLSLIPDWTGEGEAAGDLYGRWVATAGDTDGDGFDDVVVGALLHDVIYAGAPPDTLFDAGRAYAYAGSPSGAELDPLWIADGEQSGSFFGCSVERGELNDDGYDDVIIGAYGYDGPGGADAGRTYAIYGGPRPEPSIGIALDMVEIGAEDPFRVEITYTIENFGNVPLEFIELADELDLTFGMGNWSIASGPTVPGGSGLVANPFYDGISDPDILDPFSSVLDPGEVGTVSLEVLISSEGTYTNQVAVFAEDLDGNPTVDVSVAGLEPDPNGDDVPDEESITSITLTTPAPAIGIALDMAEIGEADPFRVGLTYTLENFGNVELLAVTLENDLDVVFGLGNWSLVGPPSVPGGSGLVPNPGFDGSSDPALLDPVGSVLAVGEQTTVSVLVDVIAEGTYENQVTAFAEDLVPTLVSDLSVAGLEPDPDGDDVPDEAGITSLVLFRSVPVIGAALQMVDDGPAIPFRVTLTVTLENFGNGGLEQVSAPSDLDDVFGPGNWTLAVPPATGGGSGLVANGAYTGVGSGSELLDPSSVLAIGESDTITLGVDVNDAGTYTSQIVAAATDAEGTPTLDASTSGLDPDPNGDDVPDEAVISSVTLVAPAPVIGVAFEMIEVDAFRVSVAATLENFGNVDLLGISLPIDLDAVFGAENWSFATSPEVSGTEALVLDPGFDGSGATELLDPASTLPIGDAGTIAFDVLLGAEGTYQGQLVAAAEDAFAQPTADLSVAGLDPDPNGDGVPDEASVTTVILFYSAPVIGAALEMVDAGPAIPFRVTLTYTLENFGNVALEQISMGNDLDAVFGAGNWALAGPPADDGVSTLVANAGFTGAGGGAELLDPSSVLDVGASGAITLEVDVTSAGPYANQVNVSAEDAEATQTTDFSTAGLDPDPNGDDVPDESIVSTLNLVAPDPVVGVAFDLSEVGSLDPFRVAITLNLESFGNVDLQAVSLPVNLDAIFGAGNWSFATSPLVTGTDALDVNPAYDGSTVTDVLSPTSTLPIGDAGTIDFDVTVTADGTYQGQLTASAEDAFGQPTTDSSVAGFDPDPDGNGSPDEASITSVVLFRPEPAIGVALEMIEEGDEFPYRVALTYTLENLGNVPLSALSLSNVLDDVFPPGSWAIVEAPTVPIGSGLVPNPDFDGTLARANLLDSASSVLAIGERTSVRLVLGVDVDGTFQNQVSVFAEDPDATVVSDVSVDGLEPDPDGDGVADEASVSEITLFRSIPGLGAALEMLDGGVTGPFLVTLVYTLENFGNAGLTEVTVADSLDTVFGAGNWALETSPETSPGSGLVANPAFTGSGTDVDLIDPVASTLAIGELATVSITVAVTADGAYDDQVTAGGRDPKGTLVMDASTSGSDPDPDGNGIPDESEVTSIVLFLPGPIIGAALDMEVLEITDPFRVLVTYTLENFGNTDLLDVGLSNDLDAVFGAGSWALASPPSTPFGSSLTVNPAFDGTPTGAELLDAGASTLPIEAVETITLEVSVTPEGTFTNQVTASAFDAFENFVSDVSTRGLDPDPNGDGAPGEAAVTPVTLFRPAPGIGVALSMIEDLAAPPFEIDVRYTLENFGNVALESVALSNDLDAVFGPANWTLIAFPSAQLGSGLVVDTGFDGTTEGAALLDPASTLAVGESATVTMGIRVLGAGTYLNQVSAAAVDAAETPVTDLSTDGLDPDPDGDGVPDESVTTTLVLFREMAVLGAALDMRENVDAPPFRVDLTVTLENFGNVALAEVSAPNDLDAVFGVANWSIVSPPFASGGDLVANADFTGRGASVDLLDPASSLDIGARGTVTLSLDVFAPGTYANRIAASGLAPSGALATDLSTEGLEPDPDGDDVPDEEAETAITLFLTDARVGAALDLGRDGNAVDPFRVTATVTLENFGNVELSGVALDADLDAVFGAGNWALLEPPSLSAPSSLVLAAGYDGTSSAPALLDPIESRLAIGEVSTIGLVLSVTDDGTYSGQLRVDATDPDAIALFDDSTAGLDPDPDGDGDPSEAVTTTLTLSSTEARVGAALDMERVGSSQNPFDVRVVITLENLGNVALDAVSVASGFDDVFGGGAWALVGAPTFGGAPGLVSNAGYDGRTDTEILDPASTLAVGAISQILLDLTVTPDGIFTHEVTVEADGAGVLVSDASVAGSDPDPNGDGIPDEAGETTLFLELVSPTVGIALDMTSVTARRGGFGATIVYTIENLGEIDVTNVAVSNDLDEVFGTGNWTMTEPPSASGTMLTVAEDFDGTAGRDALLDPTSSVLDTGQSATITLAVVILTGGVYDNQVTVFASGAGVETSDLSTAGRDPDPNGDGRPAEFEVTLLVLTDTVPVLDVPSFPLGRYTLFSIPLNLLEPDAGTPPSVAVLLTDLFERPRSETTWLAYGLAGEVESDPALALGRAYWVSTRFPMPAARTIRGTITRPVDVDLVRGWNAIGCPSPTPMPLGNLSVRTLDAPGERLSLAEANDRGLIGSTLYRYVDSSPDLINNGVWVPESVRNTSATLAPFAGRILEAFVPLTLTYGVVTRDSEPLVETRDWELTVTASAGGATRRVALAALEGASASWDVYDVSAPPDWTTGLRAELVHDDWGIHAGRFVRSAVPSGTRSSRCRLALVSPAPVAVTWDVGRLRPGQYAYLVLESGAAIDLVAETRTTLPAGTRDVMLLVDDRPWTGPLVSSAVGGVRAVTPSVAGAGGVEVIYEIASRITSAHVRVFDVRGRLVTRADLSPAVGTHRWRWDGTHDNGTAAGAGRYFVDVELDGHRDRRAVTIVR